MKRPITHFVVGLAILFSAQLVAQPTFTVSPQTITATPGQTVTVNIAVSNFTNILSFQYSINWNTSVLQFNSVTVPNPSPLSGFSASNIGTSNALSQGKITTSWFDPDVTGVSLANNTAIYSIEFTCLSSSGTTISFTSNPTPIEVINGAGQSIGLTPQNASVNGGGGGGGGGGGSNGLTITASDETVAAGSTVCVDVSVNGFNDILSMQFSMNFNASVLQFTGVQGLNLQDLSASNFGTTQAGSGNLTLSWLDNNAQGVSVPDGTVIFQVCFTAIGSNGATSPFNFTGTPTPIEVINGNSQAVTLTPDNGVVTVSGGGGGGGGGGNPPVVGFAIIASDDTIPSGQQVCVEISVNDFEDILSMQYSMEWDETKLQFQSITGLNLAHLTQSNFGTGQTSNGILTLSWFDNDVQGITLPDGTVIYQVCFTAIGPNNCNATTPFNFTNSPTVIEVTNGAGQTVQWQGITGDVKICDQVTPPPSGLKFIAQKDTAAIGETVCLNISVEGFNDIASAQFSIHFNPGILEYDTVSNINLAGMAPSNIGTTAAGSGTLTFSWFDPTTEGITLPNGTVIFKLCFKVIGTNGQTSNITFDGTPTVVEITNGAGQNVTPTFTNGSVFVQGAIPCVAVNIVSPIVTNVLCKGNSTGSIDISVNGGDNNYTYTWKNGSGTTVGTNQDLSGMPTGSYSVTVTSCGGQQTKTQSFTITEPAAALAIGSNPTVTNVACFGQSTGAISITVTGGTASGAGCNGYSYLWSNNATTQNLSSIAAGAYVVTVTDCNGCQTTTSVNVAQAPADFTPSATANAAKCFGQTNGSVVITPNGGVGPYQYRLLPNFPTWQSGNTFGNLAQANFTWEARDAFGCVKSGSVSVSAPPQMNLGTQATDVSSNCNGSITLTVSGGNPGGYTYNWSGPNGFTSNSQNLSNLCNGGNYCVTVSDLSGCTSQKCQIVKVPLAISSTKKDACFGACNGEINLTVIGGIAPLNYAWSGGLSGSNPKNLCPGDYTVTVTSPIDNQSQTATITITEPATGIQLLGANIQGSNFTANPNCNGAVNINAAVGGYGSPFTYLWSNGYDTQDISLVCPGTYTLTVTDKNGCTSDSTFTVLHTPNVFSLLSTTSEAPKCAGSNDGKLTIEVVGGVAPYDYTITGPSGTLISNDQPNTKTFSGLLPGNYTITVKDAAAPPDQQIVNSSEEVDSTAPMLLGTSNIYPATSTTKGKIEIEVTGGTIPYHFQWSNGFAGQNPSNLDPGCYDVTIVDANNCAQVFQDLCIGLMQVQHQIVQPSCPGETGTISVQPENGNEPYGYVWKNANGQTIDTDATLENRPVGTYSVTITDALGVTITQTISLNSVSSLAGEASQTSEITCFGGSNGAAAVTHQNGVAPYHYLWSNGAISQSIQNLTAGLYTVSVTDGEDCEIVMQVNVGQPNDLVTNIESGFNGCPSTKSGQATALATGGTQPYTYLWNDPLNQTAKTAILLEGGNYSVTITDENGCTDVATTNIPTPQPLEVTFDTKDDEGGPDGEITAYVSGGTWPYTYTWAEFPDQDSILESLLPGTYILVVTDANGCQVSAKDIKVGDGTNCLEPRTVITPEGDGRNEEFLINCLSRYSENRLEIYNRWGQLVYQVDNYNDGNLWHGQNQRGEDVPDGVYYFVFTYQDPVAGEEITKKGSVSVLRK